jgi:predicted ATPase
MSHPPQTRRHLCVVISGCSSGGKSTLIAELARRGHPVIEEPGRRIIREEQPRGGTALPWCDPIAFLRRALAMAREDLSALSRSDEWVFFDRSMIDAAVALEHLTGETAPLGPPQRYHHVVFLAPPWPEIYVNDPERRHGLDAALAEYSRLLEAYPARGYDVVMLPKTSVVERADFILGHLGAT